LDEDGTGTRVNIFKWPCRGTQSVPDITFGTAEAAVAVSARKTPSVTDFALLNKYTELPAYFDTLLFTARNALGSASEAIIKNTPVFFRATANSMLILNAQQQDTLLSKIREILGASSFNLENKVSIIFTVRAVNLEFINLLFLLFFKQ